MGTGTLNSSGVATYTTSTLAPGSDSITAVYAGDGNYTTSTASATTVTVAQATAAISSGTLLPSAVYGGSYTVTGSIAAVNGLKATGRVTVEIATSTTATGANNIITATGTLNASGAFTATFSPVTLNVLASGSYNVYVSYPGDTNFGPVGVSTPVALDTGSTPDTMTVTPEFITVTAGTVTKTFDGTTATTVKPTITSTAGMVGAGQVHPQRRIVHQQERRLLHAQPGRHRHRRRQQHRLHLYRLHLHLQPAGHQLQRDLGHRGGQDQPGGTQRRRHSRQQDLRWHDHLLRYPQHHPRHHRLGRHGNVHRKLR